MFEDNELVVNMYISHELFEQLVIGKHINIENIEIKYIGERRPNYEGDPTWDKLNEQSKKAYKILKEKRKYEYEKRNK